MESESHSNSTSNSISNSTQELDEASLQLLLLNYKYLMPIISAIGIVGNVINLVVLTSNELQKVSMTKQKVSQRSQTMFNFMKALAIIDIIELLLTVQGNIFQVIGYARVTNPVPIPSQSLAHYVWNYAEPVWRTCMYSSDFILVIMTVARLQIVTSAHQVNTDVLNGTMKQIWYIFLAICLALSLNVPHFFHYNVVECQDNRNYWTVQQSAIAGSIFWEILGYVTVIGGKVIPLFLIAILDIIIFIKLKKIVKRRSTFRKTRRRQSCIPFPNSISQVTGVTESNSTMELQTLRTLSYDPSLKRANTFSRKKEKENQLKLTKILLILGLFHFLTTIMETIAFFILTVYRAAWMNFKGRSTYATIANVLVNVNYAKNFYLYCFVHEDIRRIAVSKLSRFCKKFQCF